MESMCILENHEWCLIEVDEHGNEHLVFEGLDFDTATIQAIAWNRQPSVNSFGVAVVKPWCRVMEKAKQEAEEVA